MNKKVSNTLIGIAGVHYVVSELSRRGFIALPTIRNTAGIDVLGAGPDGSGQFVLQVKTSGEIKTSQEDGRQWWPMSQPKNCLTGPNAFYVFVRYNELKEKFEAFLESAASAIKQVEDNLIAERAVGHKDFPCWGLPKSPKDQKLADDWKNWYPKP